MFNFLIFKAMKKVLLAMVFCFVAVLAAQSQGRIVRDSRLVLPPKKCMYNNQSSDRTLRVLDGVRQGRPSNGNVPARSYLQNTHTLNQANSVYWGNDPYNSDLMRARVNYYYAEKKLNEAQEKQLEERMKMFELHAKQLNERQELKEKMTKADGNAGQMRKLEAKQKKFVDKVIKQNLKAQQNYEKAVNNVKKAEENLEKARKNVEKYI